MTTPVAIYYCYLHSETIILTLMQTFDQNNRRKWLRDVWRVVTAGADHLISDFTLSILMAECSFKCYSSKECGVSRRHSAQTAIVPFKMCTKDVLPHLRGCYKTTAKGVDFGVETLPLPSRTLPGRRRLFNYLSLTQRWVRIRLAAKQSV